eukprot:359651-Chlamydomonas_euryale.AAC.8
MARSYCFAVEWLSNINPCCYQSQRVRVTGTCGATTNTTEETSLNKGGRPWGRYDKMCCVSQSTIPHPNFVCGRDVALCTWNMAKDREAAIITGAARLGRNHLGTGRARSSGQARGQNETTKLDVPLIWACHHAPCADKVKKSA